MKKCITFVCIFVMIASLAGCQNENLSLTDYSNSTLTGKITALDGNLVALQLGQLAVTEMTNQGMGFGNEIPEMSFDESAMASMPEGNMPPEMPNGDMSGEMPEMPNGNMSGEMPEMPQGGFGEAVPENGNTSSTQTVTTFSAGEKTAIISLEGAVYEIENESGTVSGAIDDIAVGSVVVIEIGEDNKVSKVTVKDVYSDNVQMGDMGQMGGFGDFNESIPEKPEESSAVVSDEPNTENEEG